MSLEGLGAESPLSPDAQPTLVLLPPDTLRPRDVRSKLSPLRALRRQLRMGAVRGDQPQPAARRRRISRRGPRGGSWSHPAPQDRQRARPAGPTPMPTHPAPTHTLALDASLACVVAQHHSAAARHCQQRPDHPPNRPHRSAQEKLGSPATTSCSRDGRPQRTAPATSIRSIHGSRLIPPRKSGGKLSIDCTTIATR